MGADASMPPDRIDAGAVALRWLTLRDAPAVQRHVADRRVAEMTAVIAHPHPDEATPLAANPGSGRVMQKCGMTVAGELTRPFRGEPRRLHVRALDRARWRASRKAA